MAVLNSKFDILRGWPNGSAVAIDVGMEAADDHSFRAGTFVKLINDAETGRAVAASSLNDCTTANTAADQRTGSGLGGFGLIIEGLEETSAAMSKTVTVLVGGGFVARFHLEATASSNAFGSINIPNGVDQFKVVRPAADVVGDDDLAAIVAGDLVTIHKGIVVKYQDTNTSPDRAVGVVLGYDSANQTLDVLFH
tara:strand:- start:393 stop:977 length:585 start_codon:yes stop_codon:yes gene_type:complete